MVTQHSMTVRNKSGRYVGHIEGGIFFKEVYGTKHMLRNPVAWAIDCDIFDKVLANLCNYIRITDKENKKEYNCNVKTFREHGQKLNRKHGDQYYLELIYWSVM